MRTNLYRGKTPDGRWVYGNLIEHYDILDRFKKYYYIESFTGEDRNQVLPETIGQFTGLKDKNGKKIYEGDILSIKDEVGNRGQVTVGFEAEGFIIFKGLAWRYIGQYDVEINDMKVIGNIHEEAERSE